MIKNVFYLACIVMFSFSFTSCLATEECICENITITESDAKDSNVTLDEACTLAQFSDPTCSIE